MAKILLFRGGTALYADNKKASPTAGNQDALGVLRYLRQSGHEVAVFGRLYDANGKVIDGASLSDSGFGCPAFGFNTSQMMYPHPHPPAEFYNQLMLALSEVKHWGPQVMVNVTGQQPSHSDPMNPFGTIVQMSALTTNFPGLLACAILKLKRIVVMNDPRNLPREHENHYMPNTVPFAMLSQRTKTTYWETRGRKMCRREVYAGCENWWSFGVPYADLNTPRSGIIIMAHAHSTDMRVNGPKRVITWKRVLEQCQAPGLEIYGKGWDGNPHWKGLITHDQVQGVLHRAESGPMICLEKGFATGKLREYVVAGAMPRPVSFGEFHYDADNRYLAASHPARIQEDKPWSDYYDRGVVEELREKSTPNFQPLEECIEAAVKNKEHNWGGFNWV